MPQIIKNIQQLHLKNLLQLQHFHNKHSLPSKAGFSHWQCGKMSNSTGCNRATKWMMKPNVPLLWFSLLCPELVFYCFYCSGAWSFYIVNRHTFTLVYLCTKIYTYMGFYQSVQSLATAICLCVFLMEKNHVPARLLLQSDHFICKNVKKN